MSFRLRNSSTSNSYQFCGHKVNDSNILGQGMRVIGSTVNNDEIYQVDIVSDTSLDFLGEGRPSLSGFTGILLVIEPSS